MKTHPVFKTQKKSERFLNKEKDCLTNPVSFINHLKTAKKSKQIFPNFDNSNENIAYETRERISYSKGSLTKIRLKESQCLKSSQYSLSKQPQELNTYSANFQKSMSHQKLLQKNSSQFCENSTQIQPIKTDEIYNDLISTDKIQNSSRTLPKDMEIFKPIKKTLNPQNQNPLLYLTPEDFKAFNSSNELQLYFAKRKDPFLRQYVNQAYQPRKSQLKHQIREQMIELMKIRQGRYLVNLIMTQVLQQSLKLDRFQEQVEKDLKIYEKQLEKQNKTHQSGSSTIPEKQEHLIQIDVLIQDCDSEIKKNQWELMQLNDDLQRQEMHQQALKSQLEQQTHDFDQIQAYSNFCCYQLTILKQKMAPENQSLANSIQLECLYGEQLTALMLKTLKQGKQNQMPLFQHLFDLLYIELQILAGRQLKNSINKKKVEKLIDTKNVSFEKQILNNFYSTFMKSKLISQNLQKDNQIFQKCAKSQDQINFIYNLQKIVRVYICTKIEKFSNINHKSALEHRNDKGDFNSQLYDLLDANSYHSESVKEKILGFSSSFKPFCVQMLSNLSEKIKDQKVTDLAKTISLVFKKVETANSQNKETPIQNISGLNKGFQQTDNIRKSQTYRIVLNLLTISDEDQS